MCEPGQGVFRTPHWARLQHGVAVRGAASRLGEDIRGKRRTMLKNFRLQALTPAGFLLLMPLAMLSGVAFAAEEKPPSIQPAPDQKQEKRVRGEKDTANGQIKSVICKGRAMNMTFVGSYQTPHLHTDDYFKVVFSAINYIRKGTMNPCKTAKGMYPRVNILRHRRPAPTKAT
jgi:hypothetical protein